MSVLLKANMQDAPKQKYLKRQKDRKIAISC